jgi:glycosyltransferase involved in cell wall biosynthesis
MPLKGDVLHSRKGSIAIIGSRGIPAAYGGFETLAEQMAPRLSELGWEVTVSCESNNSRDRPATYKGVKLFYFPVISWCRVASEPLYDVFSMIRASLSCACIYILGYGAGLFFFIPKILRKPLVVNVDGFEWGRPKFNRFERWLLLISERAAARFADVVVADSLEVKKYYDSKYRAEVIYIPYGVDVAQKEKWDERKLDRQIFCNHEFKLQPNEYWLVVARLEPENNIHTIIESFLRSKSTRKLVIVGDSANKSYKKHIADMLNMSHYSERVILAGAIYQNNVLNMLRQNCYAYIHGHSVGGTNPALLEAMSMKKVVIAHDNPFNNEVAQGSVLCFKQADDLAEKISKIEESPALYAHLEQAAYSRVTATYTWPAVIKQYDDLFTNILKRKKQATQ